MKKVHLYHINDLHSHFDQWPKITQFIKERRSVHQKYGEEMLLFDIGDHLDRMHPITEASLGKANVRLMNQLQYDYATIGNNEGITLSYEQLDRLYEDAEFTVLVSNLSKADESVPNWLKPFAIHETEGGMKLGIIGATVAFQKFYELLNWKVQNPYEVLPQLIQEVKGKGADFIILLSHLGISDDEKIAREIEGIDLILGAHTHHLLPEGLQVHNTILCGAGKFGMNVGYVELNGETKEIKPVVYSMDLFEKTCTQTSSMIENEMEIARRQLSETVTTLTEPLKVEWFAPSYFPKLLAEAVREWCDADIGMVCSGLLLDSLSKGQVTLEDLHRVCPHPINPCLVTLEGDELKEIVLHAATPAIEQFQMKGFGFRGKVIGKMIYDGLEVKTETSEDGTVHVTSILFHGESINPKKEYKIATLDMFTFGSMFPAIAKSETKQYFLPEMLRDILKSKLSS